MIGIRRLSRLAGALALLFGGSATSLAQPLVINPTGVEFIASADHNREIAIDGTIVSVVTSYELRIYASGASSPLSTVALGKPVPDASGRIVARPAELIGLPIGAYQARVAAIGPGGEGESDPTAPFARIPAPAAPTGVAVTTGSP